MTYDVDNPGLISNRGVGAVNGWPLEPVASEAEDPRNPPNALYQASIAASLKRIADTLEEMLIMQQAKDRQL